MDAPAESTGMYEVRRSWATQAVRTAVAPFLLLVTPFAIYIQYQQYGFAHAEVIAFVLVLAGIALLLGAVAARSTLFEVATIAGLLTLFADIQLREPGLKRLTLLFLVAFAVTWLLRQHAARLVSLMIATVLALSLLPTPSEAVSTAGQPTAPGRDLPLILHVVLDEHIGLDGLPPDLVSPAVRQEFQDFFVNRGFQLFGRAYSEYPQTLWSLSHLLNLAPGGYVSDLTAPGADEDTYRLTRNPYFDRLSAQGYSVRVYQPDYLDVCTARMSPSACHTYRARSLDVLGGLDLSTRDRLATVAGTFVARSEAYSRLRQVYKRERRRLMAVHIPLPAWNWERGTAAPVGTMPIFDMIAADLANAQRGDFVFAHLLMPHYPYAFDRLCQARRPDEWLLRSDGERVDVPGGTTNTPEGRAARYRLYMEQLACTRQKLDQLMNAIPSSLRADAVVVLQGDHGSRISLLDPIAKPHLTLAPSDYADHFSTLFAVRSPHLSPAYDTRPAPITCLMRALVDSDFRSTAAVGGCSTTHVVFFRGGNTPEPRPLPAFWSVN